MAALPKIWRGGFAKRKNRVERCLLFDRDSWMDFGRLLVIHSFNGGVSDDETNFCGTNGIVYDHRGYVCHGFCCLGAVEVEFDGDWYAGCTWQSVV